MSAHVENPGGGIEKPKDEPKNAENSVVEIPKVIGKEAKDKGGKVLAQAEEAVTRFSERDNPSMSSFNVQVESVPNKWESIEKPRFLHNLKLLVKDWDKIDRRQVSPENGKEVMKSLLSVAVRQIQERTDLRSLSDNTAQLAYLLNYFLTPEELATIGNQTMILGNIESGSNLSLAIHCTGTMVDDVTVRKLGELPSNDPAVAARRIKKEAPSVAKSPSDSIGSVARRE